MKILRDTEWILYGITPEGFMFKHKVYTDDRLIVKKAKFINVTNDLVFFLDVDSHPKISVSYSSRDKIKVLHSELVKWLEDALSIMRYFGSASTTICD